MSNLSAPDRVPLTTSLTATSNYTLPSLAQIFTFFILALLVLMFTNISLFFKILDSLPEGPWRLVLLALGSLTLVSCIGYRIYQVLDFFDEEIPTPIRDAWMFDSVEYILTVLELLWTLVNNYLEN